MNPRELPVPGPAPLGSKLQETNSFCQQKNEGPESQGGRDPVSEG